MASSNRHWPSMFKSKPCNTHHQWQHDINPSLLSSCERSPYTSGCEERTPEPKPRWNPKPEQISILEAIFNSGMVNPPREEIRKIRAQLQEFGQVGDANVFYWFQNRKSRSKHKQRHLHNNKSSSQTHSSAVASSTTTTTTNTTAFAAPSSSSSSSEKTCPKSISKTMAMTTGVNVVDASMLNSPTASVNQPFYHTTHGEYSTEPFFFPVPQHSTTSSASSMFSQELCFPELSNFVQIPDPSLGNCSGIFLSELLNQEPSKRDEEEKTKLDQHLSYTSSNTTTTAIPTTNNSTTTTTTTATSVAANVGVIGYSSTNSGLININQNQGVVEQAAAAKSMVIVNDVPYEVCASPFNVREAFGDDVVLVNTCSLQTVPMNEWGVTLQSLQPGVLYYPMRTFDYLTT